jgi:hypothetical protein
MQESLLHNYNLASDHHFVGLFRQHPSAGWDNLPAYAGDRRTPTARLLDSAFLRPRF